MSEISWQDFSKIDFRAGTIVSAKTFPEARNPAYIIEVDFGAEIGVKKSSAQITDHYTRESLVGKQVIGVINFPKKQIGPIQSECLIVGLYNEDTSVILAIPDKPVPNGSKLG